MHDKIVLSMFKIGKLLPAELSAACQVSYFYKCCSDFSKSACGSC